MSETEDYNCKAPIGMPYSLREKCRDWFLSRAKREPTYQDYEKWWKREAEWEEEKEMNFMYRCCSDHENAGDRI